MNPHRSTTPTTPAVPRRQFITTSARAAALSALAAPFVSSSSVLGANDRIGLGFIGVGGRGRYLLDAVLGLAKQGEPIQVVAVNDAYGPRLRAAAEHAQAQPFSRYQDLLADPRVDAVCVATPDRLHVPQALDSIRAGKDVYCEKPMGHWSQFELSKEFFRETRRLGRVVQIGNQGNSSSAWPKVGELIRQGAIGRVQHVQAGYYRRGDWGERMPIPDPQAKPGPDLDWPAFLGDAPPAPFDVRRFFSWRMFLDYAGGPCTDLFPHVFTPFVSQLALKYPTRVAASGGIFKYDSYGREVPDTFNMLIDYPESLSLNLSCTLTNEFNSDPVIRGDEGTLVLRNPAFESGFESLLLVPAKGKSTEFPGEKPNSVLAHWRNFLHCIRTREKPVSDVEFGLYVQAAMCMAMLAFLKNKVARFDPAIETIID